MVKNRIFFFGIIFLLLLGCAKNHQNMDEVNIGVWGNWSESNQFDPVDYKSRMMLSPLLYRYLWHDDPDFSILQGFEENADTLIMALQENLLWHSGEKVNENDVLEFIKEKAKIDFELIDKDSASLKIVTKGPNRLNWYFHEPFIIDSKKAGNGIYDLISNTKKRVEIYRIDTLATAYPEKIIFQFLGEKPSYEEISNSNFDLILQLPISYLQKYSKLKDFMIEQKNRDNVAALFVNQTKIKNAGVFTELLDRQVDRKIIVDAILWNYGNIATDFWETATTEKMARQPVNASAPKGENLKVLLNRNPIRINVLHEIARQIPPSLFTLETEIVDWQKFLNRLKARDFEVVFLEWSFDSYLDIYDLWGGDNFLSAPAITGIKNNALKAYLSEYNETWDEPNKEKFFNELNKKIKETFPVTFLYRQNFVYLAKKKTKLNIAPDNWFKYIRDWQLEAENE